jgi:uncharacterized protein (DUF302 family)
VIRNFKPRKEIEVAAFGQVRQGCTAVFAAVLIAVAAQAHSSERAEFASERSFDDTIQQLEWAFGGYGMTIVSALDYQRVLSKIKVQSARAVCFEVMRRDWAKTLLTEDPSLGLLMPVRIYVFEDSQGTTIVSYQRAGPALEAHEKETVRAFGRRLEEKLSALIVQATKRPGHGR